VKKPAQAVTVDRDGHEHRLMRFRVDAGRTRRWMTLGDAPQPQRASPSLKGDWA
jgi:hypothetical protein